MGRKNLKKFNGKKRPQGRAGHLMTSCGSTLYMGGGYSESGPLSDFWQYEKEWKCLTPTSPSLETPFPRIMCDGCQFGEEVYLFGGIQQFDDEVLIQNDLWMYDSRIKCWVLLQPESPISERYNHAVTAISSTRMLVHGGECNGVLGDCWVYDIASRSFTQVPTPDGQAPCPRSSHSCVFLNPYVVVFGGVSNSSVCGEGQGETVDNTPLYLNDLWLLDVSVSADPTKWTWRMLPFQGLAPSPRDMTSLVDVSDVIERPYSLLLFGGYGLTEIYEEDEEDAEDDEANLKGDSSEIRGVVASSVPGPNPRELQSATEEESMVPLLQSSLIISDPNESPPLPLPPSAGGDLRVDSSLNASAERDGAETGCNDEEEEGSVCESYLEDAWLVDLLTGAAREVELTSRKDPKQTFFGCGWRGSRFAVLRSPGNSADDSTELCCFGGFNGQQFAEHVACISISLSTP
jgi:hypothetical protein